MLIGVVGLNGSGKDSFAQHLVEEYNFAHIDLGEEVRSELKRLGCNHLDRNEMRELGDGRRKSFGYDYWAKKALEKYQSNLNFVITSLRHPAETELIVSKGGTIIEVFADLKTRFERTVARTKNSANEHGDVTSFEEFKFKQDRELQDPDPARMQITKCIALAQFRVDNNGSLSAFFSRIDEFMSKANVN